jgi:predicted RNase H-like HicB family nuclease
VTRQIRISGAKRKKLEPLKLSFTVIYLPVGLDNGNGVGSAKSARRVAAQRKNPVPKTGYQVTVPLLPGLVTFGRTLKEAQEMARDAIECHIEGLKKSGEPIPNERLALKGELRVALSA